MELLRVDEPEVEDLRDIVDTSGYEAIDGIGEVDDDWIAKKGVPSHLWKYWKENLKDHNINWQKFEKQPHS